MAETPQNPTPKPGHDQRRRLVVLAIGVLLALLLAGFLVWWFALRDVRGDVWAETTVPVDPACAGSERCQTFIELPTGHNTGPEGDTAELQVDPRVDTPVAQWADCLDEIFVCLEERVGPEMDEEVHARAVRTCVQEASLCPAPCRERFAERTQGAGFAAVEQVFFSELVDPGGWCVPREADR